MPLDRSKEEASVRLQSGRAHCPRGGQRSGNRPEQHTGENADRALWGHYACHKPAS